MAGNGVTIVVTVVGAIAAGETAVEEIVATVETVEIVEIVVKDAREAAAVAEKTADFALRVKFSQLNEGIQQWMPFFFIFAYTKKSKYYA